MFNLNNSFFMIKKKKKKKKSAKSLNPCKKFCLSKKEFSKEFLLNMG